MECELRPTRLKYAAELTLKESCFAIIWKVKVLPVAFWKYDWNFESSPASYIRFQQNALSVDVGIL